MQHCQPLLERAWEQLHPPGTARTPHPSCLGGGNLREFSAESKDSGHKGDALQPYYHDGFFSMACPGDLFFLLFTL